MAQKKEQTVKKLNPKQYEGKNRIYRAVIGAPRISRLYVWNNDRKEYLLPISGKYYLAKKYEPDANGKPIRISEYFSTLEEARKWQASQETQIKADGVLTDLGPVLGTLIEEWKTRIFPTLAESTRVAYEKIVNLYFQQLMDLPVLKTDSAAIDRWIDSLKDPRGSFMKSVRRKSFDHELSLLGTILKYYGEYYDDSRYRYPIKERHQKAVKLNRESKPKSRDLTVEEFSGFCEKLREQPNGEIFSAMATVQYFQALRISEVAGLFWEDVSFV